MAIQTDRRVVQHIGVSAARGLQLENLNASPTNSLYFYADEIVLAHYVTGEVIRYAPCSGNFNVATNYAGSPLAPNSWGYAWLVGDGTNLNLFADSSMTGTNLPTNLPYRFYIGAFRLDGSGNLLRTKQRGSETNYIQTPASNTIVLPVIRTGSTAVGSATSVANFVPPTATRIRGRIADAPGAIVANYLSSNPNPIAFNGGNNAAYVSVTNGTNGGSSMLFDFFLEDMNLYSINGSAGVQTQCFGWKDGKVNAV